MSAPTAADLRTQEALFAAAFAAGDPARARPLYDPDVVYVSPTTRLYGTPARIEGVDATLAFIARTVEGVTDVDYAVEEQALLAEGALVLVRFDFSAGGARLRSRYVVLYRYRHGRIVHQELFYDPSGELEPLDGGGAPGR